MDGREQSLLDILRANVSLSEEDFVARNPDPVLLTALRAASSDSVRAAEAADPVSSYVDNMYLAYSQVVVYQVAPFGSHAFKGTLYILGSGDSCDVRVAGDGVADSHAMLRKGSQGWVLKNAGPGRATYVTGSSSFGMERPLEEGEEFLLSDAAKIRCGDVALEFYTPSGFLMHLKNLEAMARNPKLG